MQATDLRIDLEKIAKESLKEKNVLVEELENGMIKVLYKGTSVRNTPKPMIFPREILLDEEFVEGFGLYVGDGNFGANKSQYLDFTTIDSDIAKFFLRFLNENLFVKVKDVNFIIRYRYGNKDEIAQKWSNLLNVPKEKFVLRKGNRYNMVDNISFRISSIIFTKLFKKIIVVSLPKIKNIDTLRKAFLRGEFAADGKFIIEKDTNIFYISEITFCFNYKKEQWLKDYLKECLRLEGIKNINENREGFIRTTSWNNYIKFWEMRLLDRCERKKEKFIRVIKQMSVRFNLDQNFLSELLDSTNLSKSELIDFLDIHRTNFKRLLNSKQFLTIGQVENIIILSKFNWNQVIQKTKDIRIGRRTSIEPQESFINFLIENR